MPVADAARRGGFGDERYEKLDFQQLVRDNFLKLKEKDWKVFRQHVIFVSSATALFQIFICVSIATVWGYETLRAVFVCVNLSLFVDVRSVSEYVVANEG